MIPTDSLTASEKPERFKQALHKRLRWEDLDVEYLRQLIEFAKAEDTEGAGLKALPKQPGDVTTHLLGDVHGTARLITRDAITVAGLPLIPLILEVYGGDVHFNAFKRDGAQVLPGEVLGELEGSVQTMLTAERVLLNFLQRLSGVATITQRYVQALGWSGTKLLDTRKTTPAYRVLEKYAVVCGGGWNHRIGVYDRIMLKDNHLAASGSFVGLSLTEAIRKARNAAPHLPIEVEIDAMGQLEPALAGEPDVIMLDNFSEENLLEAVEIIGNRAWTEASGGITLETLGRLGRIGLDFVSTGAITHQAVWVDIGLDWRASHSADSDD